MLRRFVRADLALGLVAASAVLVGCGSEAEPEVPTPAPVASTETETPAPVASTDTKPPAPAVTTDTETDDSSASESDDLDLSEMASRGPIEVDLFHPDRREVTPKLGGRVVMHISSQPPNLNFVLENSSSIRTMLTDVHAALVAFNKETYEYELQLATALDIDDMLVLKEGGDVVFGELTESGDAWTVKPPEGGESVRVLKSDVESVQRGTVLTFTLRDDAVWHDGHPFDVGDVEFTYKLFGNQTVDCDEKRFNYTSDVFRCDVVDDKTVRFFYKEQNFNVRGNFTLDFCVLPSHLYNLTDPQNPSYDEDADLLGEAQGDFVNEHPNNTMWMGLGPYKVTAFKRDQYVSAEKFADYWEKDPAISGYLDELRWQFISNDNTAFEALLAGELDLFFRVKTEDYKGAATQDPAFTENFYKAHTFTGYASFTVWNGYRPHLSDPVVRRALTLAFDSNEWVRTNYLGLGEPITGMMFRMGPGYDQSVKPEPFDPELAMELLADAGWYDRDGDGVIDKDGQNFVIKMLMPSGNKASERFMQKVQSYYADVGISVEIEAMEWAQFIERLRDRDFDGANLAWILTTPESDPYQLWHSSQAAYGVEGSNYAGLMDDIVDEYIMTGRTELNAAKRKKIYHDLHQRLYDLKPYLFGYNVPRKIAINKKIRGVKLYNFDPGINLRDLYYAADE